MALSEAYRPDGSIRWNPHSLPPAARDIFFREYVHGRLAGRRPLDAERVARMVAAVAMRSSDELAATTGAELYAREIVAGAHEEALPVERRICTECSATFKEPSNAQS